MHSDICEMATIQHAKSLQLLEDSTFQDVLYHSWKVGMSMFPPEVAEFAIRNGGTFAVTQDIIDVVIVAAEQLPDDVVLHDHMLVDGAGYVVFEQSQPRLNLTSSSAFAPYGLAWAAVGGPEATAAERVALFELTTSMHANRDALMPMLQFTWVFGQPLHAHDDLEEAAPLLRFFLALMLFMDDEILVTSQRYMKRATHRRLKREVSERIPPSARIIELRRRTYQPTEGKAAPATGREYSCQWIVRGHWRNQWYPSLGVHQPKWIVPHVKGDVDKPLKVARRNVFAVVR